MRIKPDEAQRLMSIYTPAQLQIRLQAFVPSASEAERLARVAAARAEVCRITALQAANEDREPA